MRQHDITSTTNEKPVLLTLTNHMLRYWCCKSMIDMTFRYQKLNPVSWELWLLKNISLHQLKNIWDICLSRTGCMSRSCYILIKILLTSIMCSDGCVHIKPFISWFYDSICSSWFPFADGAWILLWNRFDVWRVNVR